MNMSMLDNPINAIKISRSLIAENGVPVINGDV